MSASGVGWHLTSWKDLEGTFWEEGNILYLDLGRDYMYMYKFTKLRT